MSGLTLEDVLAGHIRGDWSDRTYSCQGCRQRFEDDSQEAWLVMTDAERWAHRAELGKYIKPDWTLADYNAHVADEVRAWLAEQLDRVAVDAEEAVLALMMLGASGRYFADYGQTPNSIATAALTTVRDHLVGGAAEEGMQG